MFLGDTSVDSEIFRYSVSQSQQKFSLYQKLPTQAAIDVKYFCFQTLQTTLQTESFLIFASAYHIGMSSLNDILRYTKCPTKAMRLRPCPDNNNVQLLVLTETVKMITRFIDG